MKVHFDGLDFDWVDKKDAERCMIGAYATFASLGFCLGVLFMFLLGYLTK
jgi:hypothetical protein